MKIENYKDFYKAELTGSAKVPPGSILVIGVKGRPAGLQIMRDSNSYKIRDTVLDDTTIVAQEDTATEGWNTVGGEEWKTADDNEQWSGVVNAILIEAKSDNASDITIAWRIRE